MTIHSVIPVKEFSERIPKKNTRNFANSSLWEIAAQLSYTEGLTPIITTDSEEVLEKASSRGFISLKRPKELASNEARIEDVLIHLIEHSTLQFEDSILLLQPTSPLRTRDSLRDFNSKWMNLSGAVDVLISMTEDYGEYWHGSINKIERVRETVDSLGSARNSQLRNPLLKENGLYYLIGVEHLLQGGSFVTGRVCGHITPRDEDGDIDVMEDFVTLEAAYARRIEANPNL